MVTIRHLDGPHFRGHVGSEKEEKWGWVLFLWLLLQHCYYFEGIDTDGVVGFAPSHSGLEVKLGGGGGMNFGKVQGAM